MIDSRILIKCAAGMSGTYGNVGYSYLDPAVKDYMSQQFPLATEYPIGAAFQGDISGKRALISALIGGGVGAAGGGLASALSSKPDKGYLKNMLLGGLGGAALGGGGSIAYDLGTNFSNARAGNKQLNQVASDSAGNWYNNAMEKAERGEPTGGTPEAELGVHRQLDARDKEQQEANKPSREADQKREERKKTYDAKNKSKE